LRCIARAASADESCASVFSASAQLSYGRMKLFARCVNFECAILRAQKLSV